MPSKKQFENGGAQFPFQFVIFEKGDGMEKIVFIAAWAGIVLGFLVGSAMGLRFYDPQWLGGYASWPRRMLRLGHVSMVAFPLLNLAIITIC